METPQSLTPARPTDALRDMAVVAIACSVFATLAIYFNLSETLEQVTRPLEQFQLDELPAIGLAIALGVAWFAWRRYREAEIEVRKRIKTEYHLARSLAENQHLGQQYVSLQETERKTLARELHDELGQYLNAIKVDAASIRNQAANSNPALLASCGSLMKSVDHAHAVVRDLIGRLRPVGLDELGLAAALEHCVNHWRERLPSVSFSLSTTGEVERLDDEMKLTVYRVVQESLTNVSRHAVASRVDVRLGVALASPDLIDLSILDDGREAMPSSAKPGFGILGMRERVEVLGGRFEASHEAGTGFRVHVRFPGSDLRRQNA